MLVPCDDRGEHDYKALAFAQPNCAKMVLDLSAWVTLTLNPEPLYSIEQS